MMRLFHCFPGRAASGTDDTACSRLRLSGDECHELDPAQLGGKQAQLQGLMKIKLRNAFCKSVRVKGGYQTVEVAPQIALQALQRLHASFVHAQA